MNEPEERGLGALVCVAKDRCGQWISRRFPSNPNSDSVPENDSKI